MDVSEHSYEGGVSVSLMFIKPFMTSDSGAVARPMLLDKCIEFCITLAN